MGKTVLALVAVLATTWALEAVADPPAHAPAHGWRKKHDPEYVGYTGTRWERDYDVREGHCNRDAIGAVIGGIAGAAIGSRVGDGDGRTVAIVVGAALGALIGSRIGRAMDDGDRACIGHALEDRRQGPQRDMAERGHRCELHRRFPAAEANPAAAPAATSR